MTPVDLLPTQSPSDPPPSGRPASDQDVDRDAHRDAVRAVGAQRCSIAGALEALGDTWSILVLRELFFGVHRFNDLQRDLGISRSVLSDRLARLVDLGVVRIVPYQEPGDRARNEYRLTRKGVDLLPVMMSLMSWGDRHVNDENGPISLHDRLSGETVRLEMRTPSGRVVAPNEMEPRARR
jgi:DNA-binding HxlR family transcriptional regulator